MGTELDARETRSTRARRLVAAGFLTALVVAACGTGSTSSGGGASAGAGSSAAGASGQTGGGGSSGAGAKAGSSTAGGGPGAGGGGSAGSSNGFGGGIDIPDSGMPDVLPEGCDGVEQKANRIPLTVYVMLDHSASMAGDKWSAATEGLKAFVGDMASTDITVGLTTFPADNPAHEDCSFLNYEDPVVAFGKLPDNAKAVSDALDAADPNGLGTPIYPALGGGLDRAIKLKMATPGENFVVLMVTDGEPAKPPETCTMADPLSTMSITALADKANKSFGVKTFVVGLPGVNQAFAKALAQAGGSDAILISSGTEADIKAQFQAALAKVRGEGLGCEFPLPADKTKYDPQLVNVRYTDGKGAAHDLNRSPGCAVGEAWDYDNAQNPTKIILCKSECDTVKNDGLAKVEIVLGCPTREVK